MASLILSGPSRWSTVPILTPSDAMTSMCSAIWPLTSRRGSGETPASAVVLDLDFRVPHGIADILRTVRSRFAQRELFLHARFLADHSLFCPFLSFDDAVLEQRIPGRDGAVHGLTLDLNGFAMQANLFVHRRFDNVAAYPHATMAHIALADTKLFFVNRNHLLSSGSAVAIRGEPAVSDEETAPKSLWEATLAAVEAAAAPSPG